MIRLTELRLPLDHDEGALRAAIDGAPHRLEQRIELGARGLGAVGMRAVDRVGTGVGCDSGGAADGGSGLPPPHAASSRAARAGARRRASGIGTSRGR